MKPTEQFARDFIRWLFDKISREEVPMQSTWKEREVVERDLVALARNGEMEELAFVMARCAKEAKVTIPALKQLELFSNVQ